MREEALLGARLLLVAAAAAKRRVDLQLIDGIEQRHGLERVSACGGSGLLDDAPLVDRVLHPGHQEARAGATRELVAKIQRLLEVVSRVDVQQRKGEPGGKEGFLRQVHHHDRILSA